MAQYGIDVYGKDAKYGPSIPTPSFSVGAVTATQVDYGKISVRWGSPYSADGADWATLRVVRNTSGLPSNEDDGMLLYEVSETSQTTRILQAGMQTYSVVDAAAGQDLRVAAALSFDDTDVTPGKYYYYAVFLSAGHPDWDGTRVYGMYDAVQYNGFNYMNLTNYNFDQTPGVDPAWRKITDPYKWVLAGTSVVLAAKDNGYTDLLYNSTPRPYRSDDNLDQPEQENVALQKFLALFGFQLDAIRARYDALRYLNDPSRIYAGYLDVMAAQFGFEHEQFASPRLRRTRISNVADVARRKGTSLGIRDAINTIVGWDATIANGKNLLLHSDQADFAHPVFDDWNPYVAYSVGDRIRYSVTTATTTTSGIYQAKVANQGVAPSAGLADDTNWAWQNAVADTNNTLWNPAIQQPLSTWSTTASAGVATAAVVFGVQDPTDTTGLIHDGNAASVTLGSLPTGTTTANVTMSSVGNIYAPNAWSVGDSYGRGVYVTHSAAQWRCIQDNVAASPNLASGIRGNEPGTNADYWQMEVLDHVEPGDNVLDRYQVMLDGIPVPNYPVFSLSVLYNSGDIVRTATRPDWDANTQYYAGDLVVYGGHLYSANYNTIGDTPISDVSYTQVYPAAYPGGGDGAWEDLGPYVSTSGRLYKCTVDNTLGRDPEAQPVTYGSRTYGFGFYGGDSSAYWEYIGTAAQPWCFSAYVKSPNTTPTVDITIDWYDINGALIATADRNTTVTQTTVSGSAAVTASTSWQRVWIAASPPQADQEGNGLAAYLVANIRATGMGAGSLWVRKAQVEVSSAPTSWEAPRQLAVTLVASRVNECTNPSFETGTNGWLPSGSAVLTQIATDAYSGNGIPGSKCVQVSLASAGGGVYFTATNGSILPQDWLTASIYAKALETCSLEVQVGWTDTVGDVIQTDVSAVQALTVGEWTRVFLTTRAPDNATGYILSFVTPGSVPAGTTVLLDACLIEKTDSLGDYFDGDIYSADYVWEGTENASRSHYYEGLREKQYRLESIVADNVAAGQPFSLLYAQP